MAQSLPNKSRLLEKYVQVVREDGLNTNQNVNIGINGATANLWVSGTITVGGTESQGATTITAASANAFAVGANGTTNPTFNVNTNTASVATGLNVTGAAAGSGVTLSTISSGSNESLFISPKGTGGVIVTSTNANALAVGPNGSTNPVLKIDGSTGSQANGVSIIGGTSGNAVKLAVISSASNDILQIDGKGTGAIQLGTNSTGAVVVGRGAQKALINNKNLTSVATQNATLTATQLIGGVVEHATTTGAGTVTVDTGTAITAACPNAAVGDTFDCLYQNTGSQTATITTNTGVTLRGTVTVATGLNARLTFRLLGSNTAACYITVSS